MSAANRDPQRWPDPDQYDLSRPGSDRHLAFSTGPHVCLGAHLALTELQVMLEQTITRLPNLRLDPTATGVEMTGVGFRMVTKLPVVYDTDPAKP